MNNETVRESIPDACWAMMRPALDAAKRSKAGKPPTQSDRRFMEALIWKATTGSPWRDMPAELGPWHNVYMRFRRWDSAGIWDRFWAGLQQEAFSEAKALFVGAADKHANEDGSAPPYKSDSLRHWIVRTAA